MEALWLWNYEGEVYELVSWDLPGRRRPRPVWLAISQPFGLTGPVAHSAVKGWPRTDRRHFDPPVLL